MGIWVVSSLGLLQIVLSYYMGLETHYLIDLRGMGVWYHFPHLTGEETSADTQDHTVSPGQSSGFVT